MRSDIIKYTISGMIIMNVCLNAEWETTKYADAFLNNPAGGRAMGLGGAYTAVSGDVQTIGHNPAGLAGIPGIEISGMHSERFAGIVGYDFIGIGGRLNNHQAVAVALIRLGVDRIPVTRLQNMDQPIGPDNPVYVEHEINHQEIALMFAYTQSLMDNKFSYGLNIKMLHKNMEVDQAWGLGFDFGVNYRYTSSGQVGIVLKDGTTTLLAWKGGRRELILPKLDIGILHQFRYRSFQIIPLIDCMMYFSNMGDGAQLRWKQIAWDLRLGHEIIFNDRIAVRVGSFQGQLTAGAGIRFHPVKIDYSFSRHIDLGNSHLISVTLFWPERSLTSFLN